MSETLADTAGRNLLLGHLSAALRAVQGRLDALDGFVQEHLTGPFDAAGLGSDEQHRHFLDAVSRCVVGCFFVCLCARV